jgi:hypothetical protein
MSPRCQTNPCQGRKKEAERRKSKTEERITYKKESSKKEMLSPPKARVQNEALPVPKKR